MACFNKLYGKEKMNDKTGMFVTIGTLVVIILVIFTTAFFLVKILTGRQVERPCETYRNSSVSYTPVRCFKYFGIEGGSK